MPLDSDTHNADAHLHVEFYVNDSTDYKGQEFIRIVVPGDKTNIIEQPVRDHHKERFPRQWLYFRMNNSENMEAIGTPLAAWSAAQPDVFSSHQMQELQILKFQTVEQVATASDAQLQRVGMGGVGLRERARAFIQQKNSGESNKELADARAQLRELQAQVASLMAAKKPGRPRKEA